jgi:hypothetical protein
VTFAQQLTNFLIAQGPAILILVYAYMNGKVIRAQQDLKNLQLEKAIKDAHEKIDSKFANMSDAAIVDAILSRGHQQPPT